MDPNSLNLIKGAAGAGGAPYVGNLAVAHVTSPWISVYPWDSGFGAKYTDPSTLPAAYAYL